MVKKSNRIVKLETAHMKRLGTRTETAYSVMFADDGVKGLGDPEQNVFDMVLEAPGCWTCGCVTGYPYLMFNSTDLEQLRLHGTGKRFAR